ncbi:MAG: GyrI-like domain-containing protein [Peptococcaceae bacterium]|jgi:hypothetical protein|nr:GyrI-like domain-containing protein [Peptococcaceae bacterium]
MAYDFKKENKSLYAPAAKPSIVAVLEMTFIMADGMGDPNTSTEYQNAVAALYGIAYGVKMSKRSGDTPDGYFDFVVAPLEGLWRTDGAGILDKNKFQWTSLMRLPDFVTPDVFEDIRLKVGKKKPELDLSAVRLERFTEGLCGQITHIGSFDDEPATIAELTRFILESGCTIEMSGWRQHHEIYLSDPRKATPEKMKTIIRYPIVKEV